MSFSVPLEDAQNFQKIWTNNGIAVLLPPEASVFARDFANVVLRNFIQMCQEQASQTKIVEKEKKIIMEGVRD